MESGLSVATRREGLESSTEARIAAQIEQHDAAAGRSHGQPKEARNPATTGATGDGPPAPEYSAIDESIDAEPASGAGADTIARVAPQEYEPLPDSGSSPGSRSMTADGERGLRPPASTQRAFSHKEVAAADSSAGPATASGIASSIDHQSEFEAAKRTVALTPHEMKERQNKLEAVGQAFTQDVRDTLKDFPPVTLRERRRVGGGPGIVVGFMEEDVAAIEAATGLKFVDVGGMAGGIKAVHEGRGLFLKFAFDQEGIYQSATMAAKAAKREAAASRWVHALDSVHVSTPLLQCVDLAVGGGAEGSGYRVLRVQVYAKVDVSGSTLRVGSSNGGRTMNTDSEQVDDVVKPLASHFFLSPCRSDRVRRVLTHTYARDESADTRLGAPASRTPEAASEISGHGSASSWYSVLDFLEQERGMKEGSLARLRKDCNTRASRESTGSSVTLGNDGMTAAEQALAKEIQATIEVSRADLHHRVDRRKVEHKTKVEGTGGRRVDLQLPFDVEVHQLDSGQRMVLDTHRLLIPDLAWMDWARTNDEAKPRVWAIDLRARECHVHPEVQRGHLSSFDVRAIPRWPRDLDRLSLALTDWAKGGSSGLTSGKVLAFPIDRMQRHSDAGCVLAFGVDVAAAAGTLPVDCTTTAGRDCKSSSTDHDEKAAVVVVVSCPRWYYCGNYQLTCLLPPEAAPRLRKNCPHHPSGMSPDGIMRGNKEDLDIAREAQQLLYAIGAEEGPGAVLRELEAEANGRGESPASARGGTSPGQLPSSSYRRALKRAMHSLGLGLRHARLVLDDTSLAEHREHLYDCLTLRGGSLLGSSVSRIAASLASVDALDGRFAMQIASEARCFAAKGLLPFERRSVTAVPQKTSEDDSYCAVVDHGLLSVIEDDGACVGVRMALAGGIVRNQKKSGVKAAIFELAHLQRVGGSMEGEYIGLVSDLCSQSSGTQAEMLQCCVRRASYIGASEKGGKSCEELGDIAGCLQSLGRYDEAMEVFVEYREVHRLAFSKDNTDYAAILNNMAGCLLYMGSFDKAVELYTECREIQKRVLDKNHPGNAATLNNMATCLNLLGRFEEALELFEECRGTQESILGKEHPDFAVVLDNMAGCLLSLERFEEALELYERSRGIRESVLGKQHSSYATTLANMGMCLRSMGRLTEAMQLFEESKGIVETSLGKQHPNVASTLDNMGLCLHDMGQYDKALELFTSCRAIRESTLGKHHPGYASALKRMAQCLQSLERYKEALELFVECNRIHEENLGEKGVDFASTLCKMARCLESMERHEEALALYVECKGIFEASIGKQHTGYAVALRRQAVCLDRLERFEDRDAILQEIEAQSS